MTNNENLFGCEEENQTEQLVPESTEQTQSESIRAKDVKIRRAIGSRGFEHPAEVLGHECIIQAGVGAIWCQAKLGIGKTAELVSKKLQQMEPLESVPYVLVLCQTGELAFRISKEYEQVTTIKVAMVCSRSPIEQDVQLLETTIPHIIVGTPNRVLELIRNNNLDLQNIKHFILDDCSKMLKQLDVCSKVQEIFRNASNRKEVIIFSNTRNKTVRPVYERIKSTVSSINTIYTPYTSPIAPTTNTTTAGAPAQIVDNSANCCCIDMNCANITQSSWCSVAFCLEHCLILFFIFVFGCLMVYRFGELAEKTKKQ